MLLHFKWDGQLSGRMELSETKLSTIVTDHPALHNFLLKWRPTKPAPPVIRTLWFDLSVQTSRPSAVNKQLLVADMWKERVEEERFRKEGSTTWSKYLYDSLSYEALLCKANIPMKETRNRSKEFMFRRYPTAAGILVRRDTTTDIIINVVTFAILPSYLLVPTYLHTYRHAYTYIHIPDQVRNCTWMISRYMYQRFYRTYISNII